MAILRTVIVIMLVAVCISEARKIRYRKRETVEVESKELNSISDTTVATVTQEVLEIESSELVDSIEYSEHSSQLEDTDGDPKKKDITDENHTRRPKSSKNSTTAQTSTKATSLVNATSSHSSSKKSRAPKTTTTTVQLSRIDDITSSNTTTVPITRRKNKTIRPLVTKLVENATQETTVESTHLYTQNNFTTPVEYVSSTTAPLTTTLVKVENAIKQSSNKTDEKGKKSPVNNSDRAKINMICISVSIMIFSLIFKL
jgi:hypothetical protein